MSISVIVNATPKTIDVIDLAFSSSRWTVEVQRLLQPTRELVRSGYKTGLKVKVLLLPGG